jgi:hypothetical protein
VYTAKELVEMEAPSIELDPPNEVASYLNAEVMNDIMTTVGLKLTKEEIQEIEEKINTRFLSTMIAFLENIGKSSNVNMDKPIQHLWEVRQEISNTH